MFKRPFEETINTKNLLAIERAEAIQKSEGYRVYPIKQATLLSDGMEQPEEEIVGAGLVPAQAGLSPVRKKGQPQGLPLQDKFLTGKYDGNKWGGKYLRAPDIFFTILEKGKGKLVRLGDIAEVRFGIKTGCNEFFYLPSKHFDIKKESKYYELIPKYEGLPKGMRIEEEFLKPMLFSIKETDSIRVNIRGLKKFIFWCRFSKKELFGKQVLKYIEWGDQFETSDGERVPEVPSVRGRKYWYWLPEEKKVDIISNRFIGERFMFLKGGEFKVCDVFFVASLLNYDPEIVLPLINSTITYLNLEVLGRKTYGIGVMYIYGTEINGLILPNPLLFEKGIANFTKPYKEMSSRKTFTIYQELGINPNLPIREQKPNPLPDRKALDDIVFDILGLTEDDRNEVYWAVCELVKNRLEKARSL